DNDKLSYSWNVSQENNEVVSKTYSTGGQKTIDLTVTDNCGNTSTLSKTVDVIFNPIATFTASSYSITTGSVVIFNASASNDPNGQDISYSWYLKQGNSLVQLAGDVSSYSHVFNSNGNFQIILKVFNESGASDETSAIITVSSPPDVTLKGRITHLGNGVPNITVNASTGVSATTDSQGNYVLYSPYAFEIEVEPTHSNYTFNPPLHLTSNPTGTISNLNFTSSGGGTGGGNNCTISLSKTSHQFSENSGSTSVNVTTNAPTFSVSHNRSWISISNKTSSSFRINVSNNGSPSSRSGTVTVSGSSGCSRTITVTQQANSSNSCLPGCTWDPIDNRCEDVSGFPCQQ
ncbi:MAG: PKD domain-containing protein, partial [Bacteroidota bacterium]